MTEEEEIDCMRVAEVCKEMLEKPFTIIKALGGISIVFIGVQIKRDEESVKKIAELIYSNLESKDS